MNILAENNDTLLTGFSGLIILQAARSGAPTPVLGRMLANVAIDEPAAKARAIDLLTRKAWERPWLGMGRTFQSVSLYPNLTIFDCVRTALHRRQPAAGGQGHPALSCRVVQIEDGQRLDARRGW